YVRLLVSFQLPTLPTGAAVERVLLTGSQDSVSGSPYTKLGVVKAQHVTFMTFDSAAFGGAPLVTAGDFSANATVEQKSLDVTGSVADDYTNAGPRAGRSQYRLEFPTGTNNDGVRDMVYFSRLGFSLTLTYHVE
ncbi:MAG TPA: hypothetical protein VFV99_26110, partial [Kofleriaceae bacterium]|nr:hypothetical protein [Kofleriaceae bacterium]